MALGMSLPVAQRGLWRHQGKGLLKKRWDEVLTTVIGRDWELTLSSNASPECLANFLKGACNSINVKLQERTVDKPKAAIRSKEPRDVEDCKDPMENWNHCSASKGIPTILAGDSLPTVAEW